MADTSVSYFALLSKELSKRKIKRNHQSQTKTKKQGMRRKAATTALTA